MPNKEIIKYRPEKQYTTTKQICSNKKWNPEPRVFKSIKPSTKLTNK